MTHRPHLKLLVTCILFIVASGRIGAAQVWTHIGPSNAPFLNGGVQVAITSCGCRIASIAVDPANPDHWLVGSGNGGLWETNDAGATFMPISDDWPTQAVGAVAFASSDPKTIYVGTGEPGDRGRVKTGLGIMKSTDGGKTWTVLAASSFARASVKRIRVHPANPNVIVAATLRGGSGRNGQEGAPSPPPFGVLKSSDGGATWTRTLAGLATALEVDPTNFENQYAGIGDQRTGLLFDSPNSAPNGLYRSTDGGQTWGVIAGPWGLSTTNTMAMGRIELAFAPSNPNVLYVSMQIPPNGGSPLTGLLGLYRTDNAWAPTPTWIKVPAEATSSGIAGFSYCFDNHASCGTMHLLSVDPKDPNTLFAGGAHANLWRCTNCGTSPTWVNKTPPQGDHHVLVWAGDRLINGQDHGVYSSMDRGDTWQSHNERLPLVMFMSGALHSTEPTVAFGVIADLGGVRFRLRSGNGWGGSAGAPGGEAEVGISASRPDTDWLLTSSPLNIFRTTDAGRTWVAANDGIDGTGAAVAPIRKCPVNDDVWLAGSNRLWRTNNFFNSPAPSWSANSPAHPYPNPASFLAPGTIHAIGFAGDDPTCNTYAYGNRGGETRLTTDGGTTWRDLDPGKNLPARPVESIAFDPLDRNVIFVAFSSFDEGTPGKPGHVFRTTNAQATSPSWVNISPPGNQAFNVIAIDPRDRNSIYAGSDTGLWHSRNRGAGWQRHGVNAGLPSLPIYDLEINPTTNVIVAFTHGRGVYSLNTTAVPSSGPILAVSTTSSVFTGEVGAIYSQSLTATGGVPPYTWSLVRGALPAGLTLSPSGILNGIPATGGTYTFTVMVTDGSSAVATQTYTLTISAATALTRAGVLAQIAAGGGWTTGITLTNNFTSPVMVNAVFRGSDGSLLNIPLTTVLQGVKQSGTSSTFTGTINPNATLAISLEDRLASTVVGWADILSSGPVGGFAIFRYTDTTGKVSEGTSPLQTQFPSKFVVTYENTSGFATGMAIANPSSNPATLSVTISDQDGVQLSTSSLVLAGNSHSTFFLGDKFSVTTGKLGIVTFQSSGSEGAAALGLRFSPFGTFTSVPTIPVP